MMTFTSGLQKYFSVVIVHFALLKNAYSYHSNHFPLFTVKGKLFILVDEKDEEKMKYEF